MTNIQLGGHSLDDIFICTFMNEAIGGNPEQAVDQTVEVLVILDALTLMSRHGNESWTSTCCLTFRVSCEQSCLLWVSSVVALP